MPLLAKHCVHKATKLEPAQIDTLLEEVPGYAVVGSAIEKTYPFADFYETMAFVNALAYIANQEDHHPELSGSYGKCGVRFSTHDASGLTENDFICAARVNALLRSSRDAEG